MRDKSQQLLEQVYASIRESIPSIASSSLGKGGESDTIYLIINKVDSDFQKLVFKLREIYGEKLDDEVEGFIGEIEDGLLKIIPNENY